MGRWYSGDIDGKFWFGVQPSDDADNFGYIGEPLYYNDPPEEGEEPYALVYSFTSDYMDEINEGIQDCVDELGEYKEKLDVLFSENPAYDMVKIMEQIGCDKEKTMELVSVYARLLLGNEIKKCVEETGGCFFDAEL